MKTIPQKLLGRTGPSSRLQQAPAWLVLALVACQAEIEPPTNGAEPWAPSTSAPADVPSGSGGAGQVVDGKTGGRAAALGGSAGVGVAPPVGSSGAASTPPPTGGSPLPEPDVNRVPIHRLNNAEYDNTTSDLLGTSSKPGAAFIADEKQFGFDNIAAAFGISDARYEQYVNAADSLVTEAFADAALKKRLLVCEGASNDDVDCARRVLAAFAPRALRRPVTDDELERLLDVFDEAVALGEDFEGGIQHAFKALLSSAQFLYRIEIDPDPASEMAHPLTAHELASRLSYLVWSTMPDAELFQQAESGALLESNALDAQLARLFADPKAERFTSNFAGQWLGFRALGSHQVEASTFPDWNEPLRKAMIDEGFRFVSEFLSGDRPMTEFFTADVQFVNAPLAKLYDFPAASGNGLTRVTETGDARRGFLGLASFLTLTSFAQRTAPTLRGKWVLENLLCVEVAPPPAAVPELETGGANGGESQNVRERLEQHRADPGCAGCHRLLDPIGLGLESFDAIGKYRTEYEGGDAVDASGELPDGRTFNGLLELSTLLADDPRFADCVVEKLMTYALSREIVASDAAYLEQLKQEWALDGMRLDALVRRIVANEAFRSRRGEPG